MGLSATETVRNAFVHDVARTRLQQDVRSALDLIGTNVRQAGEGFTGAFPAIEVTDGASGGPDELVLRRVILSDKPNVCTAVAANSSRGNIFFTNATPTPGCAYSSNGGTYNAWRTHRLAKGGQVKAYIFNTATKQGEFFTYRGENNSGSAYNLVTASGTWGNAYPVGSSQLYVLEEWRYRLGGDELELVENGDAANPWDVAFGLTNFQASVVTADGTTHTSFPRTADWTQIRYVEVTLSGRDTARRQPMTVTLTSRYFPRNVLSN